MNIIIFYITNKIAQSVIFDSLIRLFFNASYLQGQGLDAYPLCNRYFIRKCEDFSWQTVSDLNLSKSILQGYTAGLTIVSLFSPKQLQMIEDIQYLTNPIDLFYHIYMIVKSLSESFSKNDKGTLLSDDDIMALFSGLISVSPPCNAVAIAVFLEKWSVLSSSQDLIKAKNYYVSAILRIFELKEISQINELERKLEEKLNLLNEEEEEDIIEEEENDEEN